MIKDSAKKLVKKLWALFVNRETISYIIAGLLTTAVNFISYESLYQLGVENLIANAWAWVIAVSFAYIVNKKGVFYAKSNGIVEELSKISKFFAARLITLGVEEVGMYYFVERLGVHRLLIKLSLAVIVIILNYIFSKLYVFKIYPKKLTHEE